MPGSNYLNTNMLNAVLRNTPPASWPSTVYVALFTTNPTAAGTGTEVSGNGYARTAVTFGSPVSGGSGGRQVSNSAAVNFPSATGSWGTVGYYALFDASTGGNMLYFNALPTSLAVTSGMQLQFQAGALTVTLT